MLRGNVFDAASNKAKLLTLYTNSAQLFRLSFS